VSFLFGNVEDVLPKLIDERNLSADVVFLDPPRKGCERLVLDMLLETEVKKIVYISCNPATLGRDFKILEEKYELKKVAICDMFPWTTHVECISVLNLKKNFKV